MDILQNILKPLYCEIPVREKMTFDKILKPFAKYLNVPSQSQLSKWQSHHGHLNVTDDYLEVLQSGVLGMDLGKYAPVNWKKVKDAPRLASDIAVLGRAGSMESEGLPKIFNEHFYVIGETFGGDCVVQLSEQKYKGKLALLLDFGELERVEEVDLASLVKANLIELSDMTLADYVELRFSNATKPKRRPVLDTQVKLKKALEKALAKISIGHIKIERFDASFEFPTDLDFSEVTRVSFLDCGFESLPKSLDSFGALFGLTLKDCPCISEIPNVVGQQITHLSVEDCPTLDLPASGTLPKLVSLEFETKATALPTLGGFTTLQSIRLKGAELTNLPDTMGQLDSLTQLEIYECANLCKLPETIGQLSSLTLLEIYECPKICKLPDSLCTLESLEKLIVYDTGLDELPAKIGDLKNLKDMRLGSWGSNQLKTIPDSVCDLESLQSLWLGNNTLEELPSRIGDLQKLSMLYVEDNQLTKLPESVFDLSSFCLQFEFKYSNNPIPPALVKEYKKRIKAAK